MRFYLIGSLRNPQVPLLAQKLRATGIEVFDDWYAAGEKADDSWQAYEEARGHTYTEALAGYAARHVFEYDKYHLDTSDGGILLAPAGRSSYLELGYLLGQGKPGYIVLPAETGRWDVMVKFATAVFESEDGLLKLLGEQHAKGKERDWDYSAKYDSLRLLREDIPTRCVE